MKVAHFTFMSARYRVSQSEREILERYSQIYFNTEDRTERYALVEQIAKELSTISEEASQRWSLTNVRQWFTNARNRLRKLSQ